MIYTDRFTGKKYEVESVTYGGMYIQVNGTTITDIGIQDREFHIFDGNDGQFSVFIDGDEIIEPSFEKAYNLAMND